MATLVEALGHPEYQAWRRKGPDGQGRKSAPIQRLGSFFTGNRINRMSRNATLMPSFHEYVRAILGWPSRCVLKNPGSPLQLPCSGLLVSRLITNMLPFFQSTFTSPRGEFGPIIVKRLNVDERIPLNSRIHSSSDLPRPAGETRRSLSRLRQSSASSR
jgi:hypothetical protein